MIDLRLIWYCLAHPWMAPKIAWYLFKLRAVPEARAELAPGDDGPWHD